jgi:hypothetical protein
MIAAVTILNAGRALARAGVWRAEFTSHGTHGITGSFYYKKKNMSMDMEKGRGNKGMGFYGLLI